MRLAFSACVLQVVARIRKAERRDEEVGGGGGGCAAHAEAEETQHGMNNAETQMYAPSDDEDENQENVAQ